jgi:hypothetical protein
MKSNVRYIAQPARVVHKPRADKMVIAPKGEGTAPADQPTGAPTPAPRRAAPGEMPMKRLNARLNAASDW